MSGNEQISLGFAGLHASPGAHVGHFYSSKKECRDFLVPFVQTGLERGDKCVCVMSPGSQPEVGDALRRGGIDVDSALQTGQLWMFEGRDEVEGMQAALREAIDDVRERFNFLRWVGDMTWSLGKMPDSPKLMEWECACNVVENPPAVFLCQYDLTSFNGTVVFDALKTHPLCIIGNSIRRNPYYVEPETFLRERRTAQSGAAGQST